MCLHVEQEIVGDDQTVLDTVVKTDVERLWLLDMEKKLLEKGETALAGDGEEDGGSPKNVDVKIHGIGLMEVYDRLEEIEHETVETRAATILAGLGFDSEAQGRPTKEFSGGWRMRIALSRALFMRPDLLLLDEPTNHLDVDALTWLEDFIQQWEKTTVIVSHDRGFLNNVSTASIFCNQKRLRYYGGNYDTFVRVRAEHMKNQEAMMKMQGNKVAHLKQFIARFGQGHKKMAKQAQSRMKLLSKIQEEAVDVDFDDPYLKLDFPSPAPLPPPCISVLDTSFGYNDGSRLLYKNLNFGVDCESRVAIVGPNGAGKSTFLKLLEGTLEPTDGAVRRHAKVNLALFTQHHIDMMDPEKDAVNHMRRLDGEKPIEECRKYLGRFGLAGDTALQPIKTLSGGQKSRVAFAELAMKQPHILMLDEPTNHLDLETIEALSLALNKFEGGVVLVSHDERLISLVADEIWVVSPGYKDARMAGKWVPGKVTVFEGSFDEYRELLRAGLLEKRSAGGRIKRGH
jgi:ATP-binding cassette subfamily F protein 2